MIVEKHVGLQDMSEHLKCDLCKSNLQLCPADFPYNPDFWICPKCDSTYVKDEYDITN